MGAIWRKYSTPTDPVPLRPARDPEHLSPTGNLEFPPGIRPAWASTVVAPALPHPVLEPDPRNADNGLSFDNTPYHDLAFGPGAGAALDDAQARERALPYNLRDDGSFADRRYQPMVDRDGPVHVETIPDTDNSGTPDDGASQATVAMRYNTGVGAATDQGNSRLGQRFKLWVDRVIDMHWWDVEFRPMYSRIPDRPSATRAVPTTDQQTSPFPRFSGVGLIEGTPDRFVAPQVRRTPQPWDNSITRDPRSDMGPIESWGL